MQYFEYKIKIIIFKYVLNLALPCRSCFVIAKDPNIKSEWLMLHYGKVCALFHAVKLGSTFITFINVAVHQTLIVKKVIMSKYFVYSLIELKIDTILIRTFQRKIKLPPAHNLPTTVLDEWYKQLSNEDLPSKGNVSAIPHYVRKNLSKDNLKDIEYLILNKRLIPYLQPKALKSPIPEEYLFKDDYKNDKRDLIKFLDLLRQRSLSRYYYNNMKFTVNMCKKVLLPNHKSFFFVSFLIIK